MFNFMPTANINSETGIRFGAISGHSLDHDVLLCLVHLVCLMLAIWTTLILMVLNATQCRKTGLQVFMIN